MKLDTIDDIRKHSCVCGECWIWDMSKTTAGYGTARIGGKNIYVHRLSWSMANGIIPKGMWILHRCDNPACFNPDHLFLGTPKDNTADSVRKGRHASQRHPESKSCEMNGNAKLTKQIARWIRQSKIKSTVWARFLGVWPSTVDMVKRGKTWRLA